MGGGLAAGAQVGRAVRWPRGGGRRSTGREGGRRWPQERRQEGQ